MKIIRVTAQNLWRLNQIERTPYPNIWTSEAEGFLFDGRAVSILRNNGTIFLASEANRQDPTDPLRFVGVAISYVDLQYHDTTRLGSLAVDHRFRSQGIGRALFTALLDESLRERSYSVGLVHEENVEMLALVRSIVNVTDEARTSSGYIQFFAERPARGIVDP